MSTSTMTSPKIPAFSLGRIWTLATSTFTQLARMKVFYFVFVFVLVVGGVGLLFHSTTATQSLKTIRDIGFGAMYWFSLVFAVAGTAVLIPKDIEDRTLYTILTKPVPRFEYLFGKFLGVMLLILASLVVMDVLLTGLLAFREWMIVSEIDSVLAQIPEESEDRYDLLEEKAVIESLGANWAMHGAVLVFFMKAAVCAAISLLLSTFATSTLFTVLVGSAVVIIGHGQSLARDYFLNGEVPSLLERLITVGLALLFPDLGMFNITDSIAGGSGVSWEVLLKLGGLAALYVAIYNVVANLIFAGKEF